MNLWYVTRRRSEILIAIVRLALLLFTYCWMSGQATAFLIIAAVAALAIAVALRSPYFRSSWRIAFHIFDFLLFVGIIHLAAADDVLTIISMFFLIFSANLRFEWNGTMATGLAAAYVVAWRRLIEPGDTLTHAILITALMFVTSAAAAAYMRYWQRKNVDVATVLRRNTWPRTLQTLLREQLEDAASAMRVPRVALAWRSPNAPAAFGVWSADGFRTFPPPLDDLAAITPSSLEGLDFFSNDAAVSRSTYTAFGPIELTEQPVDHRLRELLGAKSLLLARFEGSLVSGALLYLDRQFDSDDLLLGRLSAEAIASRLDFFLQAAERETIAAGEERTRIARDLHDGILQSLGGISMQLEAAGKLVSTDPAGARTLMRKIQDILAVDQHEIRSLVDGTRVHTPGRHSDLRTQTRFTALAALVRMQWGADVDLRLESLDGKIEKSRRREIHRLVREAVVNAAKHSDARRITVEGALEGEEVRIVVKDDGRGFPFIGRYDLAQLVSNKQGPASLKERVALLGGSLVVDSRTSGSTVEITLPLGASA